MSNSDYKASAVAHPNFALTKYWGKHPGFDPAENVPPNDRVSMVASAVEDYDMTQLETHTTIEFSEEYDGNTVRLNHEKIENPDRIEKVVNRMLDGAVADGRLEVDGDISEYGWRMESVNDFPTKAGLASSASGFAALVKAVDESLDLDYSSSELAHYAMKGSGSAAGGIHDGIVDCRVPAYGNESASLEDIEITSLDDGENIDWSMVVAVVSGEEKEVGSSTGHKGAEDSAYHRQRVRDSNKNAAEMREKFESTGDEFDVVGELAERDAVMLHNVMRTQDDGLVYDNEDTMSLKRKISRERSQAEPMYWTQDAGPNLKIMVRDEDKDKVRGRIGGWEEVQEAIPVKPGQGARLIGENLF